MANNLYNILKEYEKFPQVKAIALGGSNSAKTSDSASDVDVYIFITENIPVELREKLVKKVSSNYEVGGEYFGSGDEFFVDELNKQLDVMFWNVNWFENIVENIWENFYPSNGYSTCFLYTLNIFDIIYDSDNWLQNLQNKLLSEYPKTLQQNIIHRNLMLMKDKPFASYYEQIEKAIHRNDYVSINHRISAFIASYFDIIFALNKLLHPGEKRLIQYCKNNCSILPKNFEENLNNLFNTPNQNILNVLDEIIKNLKDILYLKQ